jgi:hypothetical protein
MDTTQTEKWNIMEHDGTFGSKNGTLWNMMEHLTPKNGTFGNIMEHLTSSFFILHSDFCIGSSWL